MALLMKGPMKNCLVCTEEPWRHCKAGTQFLPPKAQPRAQPSLCPKDGSAGRCWGWPAVPATHISGVGQCVGLCEPCLHRGHKSKATAFQSHPFFTDPRRCASVFTGVRRSRMGQGQTLEQQHLERASGVICVAWFWLLAGEFNSWRYHDRPTQPHADLPFSPLLPHLCRGRNVPSSAGH